MGIPSNYRSDEAMLRGLESHAEIVESGIGRFSACSSGTVGVNYNDVRKLCALARLGAEVLKTLPENWGDDVVEGELLIPAVVAETLVSSALEPCWRDKTLSGESRNG